MADALLPNRPIARTYAHAPGKKKVKTVVEAFQPKASTTSLSDGN